MENQLEWSDDKMADAKSKFTKATKQFRKDLDDVQFFLGESSNPDGIFGLLKYPESRSEEVPILMFFKHGLGVKKAKEDGSFSN